MEICFPSHLLLKRGVFFVITAFFSSSSNQAETLEQRVEMLETRVSELQRLVKGGSVGAGKATEDSQEVRPQNNPSLGGRGTGASSSQNQNALSILLKQATQSYRAQNNEIRKSAIREERKKQLQMMFMDSREFSNWIGTLTRIGTNSDGHAEVVIRCGEPGDFAYTIQNMSGLINLGTLIEKNTLLYKKLGQLQEGQRVHFSGKFESGENDFINELSLTEGGSMSEPEFEASFSDISPF